MEVSNNRDGKADKKAGLLKEIELFPETGNPICCIKRSRVKGSRRNLRGPRDLQSIEVQQWRRRRGAWVVRHRCFGRRNYPMRCHRGGHLHRLPRRRIVRSKHVSKAHKVNLLQKCQRLNMPARRTHERTPYPLKAVDVDRVGGPRRIRT